MPLSSELKEPRSLTYRTFAGSGIDQHNCEAGSRPFQQRIQAFLAEDSSRSPSDIKLTAKVVVVGAANVGKTCLMVRHCDGTFTDNYKATIGVDFMASRYSVCGIRFILQIWDTAGQERFKSVSTAFFRGAMCCIACFDLGNRDTLHQTRSWVHQVRAENTQAFAVFLVGCKSDVARAVTATEAERVATELGAEYIECSSKTGARVDELFDRIAIVLFDKCIQGSDLPTQRVSIRSSLSSVNTSTSIRLEKDEKWKNPVRTCC